MDFRLENSVIADKYVVKSKIGSGSFGEIYMGYIKGNSSSKIAIKFEKSKNENEMTLRQEAKILYRLKGKPNFPPFLHFCHHKNHFTLIMPLLGSNLESLFNECNKKFSLKTISMLAVKMVEITQEFHKINFLHRDIKPENWLVGTGAQNNKIYMIDFGLSKRFADDATKTHIAFRENKGMIGTPRYASLSAHLGHEQGRKDDLESIAYVLIYFARKSLPWQDLKGSREKKMETVKKMKEDPRLHGSFEDLPVHFEEFTKEIKKTKFDEEPNYEHLKGIFECLLKQLNHSKDDYYDWIMTPSGREKLLEEELRKMPIKIMMDPDSLLKANEDEKAKPSPSGLNDGQANPQKEEKKREAPFKETRFEENFKESKKTVPNQGEVGSGKFLDVPKSQSFIMPSIGQFQENSGSQHISLIAIKQYSDGILSICSDPVMNSRCESSTECLQDENFSFESMKEMQQGEIPVFMKIKHMKSCLI